MNTRAESPYKRHNARRSFEPQWPHLRYNGRKVTVVADGRCEVFRVVDGVIKSTQSTRYNNKAAAFFGVETTY